MKTICTLLAALLLLTAGNQTFATDGGPCDPPSITCPQNITVTADDCYGAEVTYSVTTFTPGGLGTVEYSSDYPTDLFSIGTTTVTATVHDLCGNSASCSFTITVNPMPGPQITSCPGNTTVTADDCYGAEVTYGTVSATAAAGLDFIDYSADYPTDIFSIGTTTVTATAYDLCGNTASCSFTVTVNAMAGPTITCPPNKTQTATDCYGAEVTYGTISANAPAGIDFIDYGAGYPSDFFSIGTTTVTATVYDYCGNTASCSFTVTVNPLAGPTITCPANVTADADQCGSAYVDYAIGGNVTAPAGIDYIDYGGHDYPSDYFAVGTTTVTETVHDYCGNTATCSFTVTVNPPANPTIDCPGNMTVPAESCQGTNVDYTVFPNADMGVSQITYGNHDPNSLFPVGTTTVTATVFDICGHSGSCTFDVTVSPPAPPTITCPANITAVANAQGCSKTVTFLVSAFSSVGLSGFSVSPPSGSSFPLGTTTVTATATDACGNTSTCTFTVTINSPVTVNAGPDVSTVFGYSSTQTVTRTAIAGGGSSPYSYSWSLSRALKCNQVNSTGDELFTGGSCSNNNCPVSGSSTPAAPSCSGNSTISATLLEPANAYILVTDAYGCTARDTFHIDAVDGRCFTGNAGKNKTKICHNTGSATNAWVTICIGKSNMNAYLAAHPADYLGPCAARYESSVAEEDNGLMFFPNPFSDIGTIRFTAAEDTHAELEVFSSTGAKIETLFSGDVSADETKEFRFDGSALPRGIYLCKLTAGSEVYNARMILMK